MIENKSTLAQKMTLSVSTGNEKTLPAAGTIFFTSTSLFWGCSIIWGFLGLLKVFAFFTKSSRVIPPESPVVLTILVQPNDARPNSTGLVSDTDMVDIIEKYGLMSEVYSTKSLGNGVSNNFKLRQNVQALSPELLQRLECMKQRANDLDGQRIRTDSAFEHRGSGSGSHRTMTIYRDDGTVSHLLVGNSVPTPLFFEHRAASMRATNEAELKEIDKRFFEKMSTREHSYRGARSIMYHDDGLYATRRGEPIRFF